MVWPPSPPPPAPRARACGRRSAWSSPPPRSTTRTGVDRRALRGPRDRGRAAHGQPADRACAATTSAQTYARAKSTMAIVVSPPSRAQAAAHPAQRRLAFDLAEGCPAHCQYCYLAGSLSGPPVTRVYADLDEILDGLAPYVGRGHDHEPQRRAPRRGDDLRGVLLHRPARARAPDRLAGSARSSTSARGTPTCSCAGRRSTTTSSASLGLDHARAHPRALLGQRAPVDALRGRHGPARGAASPRSARWRAAGYPVGLTIAPIMPLPDWREHYGALLDLRRRRARATSPASTSPPSSSPTASRRAPRRCSRLVPGDQLPPTTPASTTRSWSPTGTSSPTSTSPTSSPPIGPPGAEATIHLIPVDDPSAFGVVELDDDGSDPALRREAGAGHRAEQPDQRRDVRARAERARPHPDRAAGVDRAGDVPGWSPPAAASTRWPPTTTGSTPAAPSCTCRPTST